MIIKILKQKKILGAVQKLSAKQHSQFSPKLGWIGCAIQQATSKWLPGFFFCFNILIIIYFLNMKLLRLMAAHFCHLMFHLQVVRRFIKKNPPKTKKLHGEYVCGSTSSRSTNYEFLFLKSLSLLNLVYSICVPKITKSIIHPPLHMIKFSFTSFVSCE